MNFSASVTFCLAAAAWTAFNTQFYTTWIIPAYIEWWPSSCFALCSQWKCQTAGIINFFASEDKSQHKHQVFEPEVIIHREFLLLFCLLCTCISWVTSSSSLPVFGSCFRNNLWSTVRHMDLFPQPRISISKCQTTWWLPVHLSFPVHTQLLASCSSCEMSCACAFNLNNKDLFGYKKMLK